MLAGFVAWWVARMTELCPWLCADGADRIADALVVEADPDGALTASLRRNGREAPATLGSAGRRPILLRVPAAWVLRKRHILPTAPRRDIDQMLRHELGRITPFPASALFWRWDGQARPTDKTRTEVTITMVPRLAVAQALEQLAVRRLEPRFLEVGPPDRPQLLPVQAIDASRLDAALRWICAGLGCIAVILPFLLQSIALYRTDRAIDALGPTVAQVQALRRGSTAETAGQQIMAQERAKTGDVLQILALVTRILPDDTFLTDFTLRNRHLTIGGRSASTPGLITGLSADPAIRGAAFAAPITRVEGTRVDVFSIQGEVVP